ncbi:MAG: SRPBCC domain-containing protein [Actinomycetota bacterium]|nr:SRPBCC domain-containing protein [Actinomycetota bacterium]
MEHGTIERTVHIDASPEVVFDVVSNPTHVRAWWPDEAEFSATPGAPGRIGFDQGDGAMAWEQFTIVDAIPYWLFSFRWTHAEGTVAAANNSFLVTFELEPAGTGTLLHLTESGFRERGWDDAKVAAEHASHVSGWDHFLPRLPAYAAGVGTRS